MIEPRRRLFTRETWMAAAALLLLFLAALAWEGRPAWCEHGFGLLTSARTQCTSQHLADPYTLSHVLHGILFYWLLVPLAGRITLPWRMFACLVLEVGWEVLENSPWAIERYRRETAALGYMGDSVLNALGDVAATVVGFAVAWRFSWKVSVALFIAFELWMLYLARDNLTLNVLMLLAPIEFIKQWQLRG